MGTVDRRPHPASRRGTPGHPGVAKTGSSNGTPWPLALAGALAASGAAMLLLRPRDGSIEPDPVDVGAYFSDDDIARARRFGRPQLALHAGAGLMQAVVLAACARRAGRTAGRSGRTAARGLPGHGRRSGARRCSCEAAEPARASLLGGRVPGPLLRAAGAGVRLSLAVGLVPLPLQAIARRRALAAGLATQSWSAWAWDLARGAALGTALNALAAPVAVALMRRFPRGWWLPGAAVAVAGAGTLTFVGPVLLDPLFNRFTVLPGGAIRDDVLELAARAGVDVGEVYEVDASTRTTAANAYVSGLGATKRVVLFDTLLREFTREEIRLVVAHELAHVRHRDVPRGLAHLALSAPAAMYAAAQLTRRLGRAEPASEATLPALVLSLGFVSVLVGALAAALSRQVERRADAFSLALADAPEPFISFERRIVRQNLADPDPPRWLVALLGTHPPTVERIGIACAYRRGARPARAAGR
jgi:STE24 endopeptidase